MEIYPEVRHLDGTIGMARTSDPNDAARPYVFDDGRQRQLKSGGVDLDGSAVFGRRVTCIEAVWAIGKVTTTTRYGLEDGPVEAVIIWHVGGIHPTAEMKVTEELGDVSCR